MGKHSSPKAASSTEALLNLNNHRHFQVPLGLGQTSMVNLYVFNPSSKLRFLNAFLQKTSKRIRKNIQNSQRTHRTAVLNLPDIHADQTRATFNLKVFDLIDSNSRYLPQGRLFRDVEYYKDEREAGLCVFRVEDTLFKVSVVVRLQIQLYPEL